MPQQSLSDLPSTIAKDIQGFVPAPVRKLFGAYSDTVDKATKGKKDTTWHDKEVDEANESFRKAAQKKAAADPKLGAKKKSTKPAAKKKAAVKKRS